MSDLGNAAVQFVDLLTPNNFEEAKKWLASDCKYKYGNQFLEGEAIIKSFKDNHNHASSKLDKIQYDKGEVEYVDGRTVSVIVTDILTVKGENHIYKDRLIVTFNDLTGYGSVTQIENKRVDGERDKLYQFFDRIGLDWPKN